MTKDDVEDSTFSVLVSIARQVEPDACASDPLGIGYGTNVRCMLILASRLRRS